MNAEQERLIERIRKLLRLGKNNNHVGEAEAAIAKAYELANTHGIAIAGLSDESSDRITSENYGPTRKTYARSLCQSIMEYHFGVKMLHNTRTGCVCIGPAVNIAIARHIEVYLLREHAAEMAGFKKTNGRSATSRRRRSFTTGWFVGIYRTLESRPLRNDQQEKRSKLNVQIASYAEKKFCIKNHPLKMSGMDRIAQGAGFCLGSQVNLSRPVEGAASAAQLGTLSPKSLTA